MLWPIQLDRVGFVRMDRSRGELQLLKTFRLQLRFLVPLVIILTATAYLALPVMDRLTLRWFARDLDMRGALVANALSDSLADAENRSRKLQAILDRTLQDERLVAIGWCSTSGQLARRTARFPKDLTCEEAKQLASTREAPMSIEGGPVHVSFHPIVSEAGLQGDLVLMHDLSFIERRSQDTRKYLIILIAGPGRRDGAGHRHRRAAELARLGVGRAGAAARRGPGAAAGAAVARTRAAGGRPARTPARPGGRGPPRPALRGRVERRAAAVAAAHATARRRGDRGLQPRAVRARTPAGRQHGGAAARQRPGHRRRAGDARLLGHLDRARQRQRRPRRGDRHDHVALPPGQDDYQLRRLWLTEEQEQGYYYGFANEGLWPLCHVAHVPARCSASRTGSTTAK
jgi:trehalose 6-phosphate synthase